MEKKKSILGPELQKIFQGEHSGKTQEQLIAEAVQTRELLKYMTKEGRQKLKRNNEQAELRKNAAEQAAKQQLAQIQLASTNRAKSVHDDWSAIIQAAVGLLTAGELLDISKVGENYGEITYGISKAALERNSPEPSTAPEKKPSEPEAKKVEPAEANELAETKTVDKAKEDIKEVGSDAKGKIYTEINLAERTLSIGDKTINIISEPIWGFLKTLVDNKRQGLPTPYKDGHVNWKNPVDMLRRKIGGNEALHQVVQSSKGLYYLKPSVKIRHGGQVGIRPTKSDQHKPGVN